MWTTKVRECYQVAGVDTLEECAGRRKDKLAGLMVQLVGGDAPRRQTPALQHQLFLTWRPSSQRNTLEVGLDDWVPL